MATIISGALSVKLLDSLRQWNKRSHYYVLFDFLMRIVDEIVGQS